MKYIQLLIATGLLALLTVSCDQNLPYPIEDVKKGVVIDIVRVSETDAFLKGGVTDGNYKVKMSIPSQQGDYSMLDYAQLLCVFTDLEGKTTSKVVVDNIKTFPTEISINMADVYQKLGKSEPVGGEVLYFTTNCILKDGYLIAGWNEYSGFNNIIFTSWEVDNRNYSYNVRYPVACPLVIDDFVGQVTINDPGLYGDKYTAEVVKNSETELEIRGFYGQEAPYGIIKIKIDPKTYTVSVARQTFKAKFQGYNNLSYEATGTIDACKGEIELNGLLSVDEGNFGNFKMTIKN